VEFSEKQSFLACIADAKYYGDTQKIPSIKEMKQIIINSLNIDDYITYQNGNNVTSFMVQDFSHIKDVSKYKGYALYKKIYNKSNNKTEPYEEDYFKGVVASYENFLAYLNDDTQVIDYTYLWDII
jgi:transcription elongation factor GreA-like protein